MPIYIADNDYLPTIGAKLLMGHSFPEGLAREHQQIVLNREAIRAVGWQNRAEKDVVGKMIDVNGLRYELAGVVDDYHFMSLKQKITPMAILSHYYQDYTFVVDTYQTRHNYAGYRKCWRSLETDLARCPCLNILLWMRISTGSMLRNKS
ncbi:MAG: ABC transporter permease [Bacteroidota bacterium]